MDLTDQRRKEKKAILTPYCCCSAAKWCTTLCKLMDSSTQVFPVLHYLPVCSHSYLLSWWRHSTISSSLAFFSFCPQSFPASGSFPMSWLFTSNDQNTGASASVLPTGIQCWFPLILTGLISLLSRGLLGVFFSTTVWRHQLFDALPSL